MEKVEIKSLKSQFLATDSIKKEEVINDDNWVDKVPRLTRNKPFLWSRSKIVFTDGTVSISEPSKTSYTYIGFFERIIMCIKKLFK